ncbi:hypothetical protein PG994_004351 [Apiospora phragmitis]|uniref:Uncharacterized protein n=1 Tax=Apiospora phragmitis TaxID=2905665 RepID=A0ABR1VQK9_9PEZI
MEPILGQSIPSTNEDKQPSWKLGGIFSRCFSKSDWWLEIGSSLLSVLCLLGMIILLGRIQNQPLSSWNSVVSPNAFISVLSIASKACLVQPVSECISQLKWSYLLQRKKAETPSITRLQEPTKSILPYVSCSIILAAVATESFAQQILSFESRPVVVNGVYSEFRISQYLDSFDDIEESLMQKAITLALYGEPQLPDLPCPGSLCQYPSFAPLGVTSDCQDVTELSRRDCTKSTHDSVQYCNVTTPGGFILPAESGASDKSEMAGTSEGNKTLYDDGNGNTTDGAVLLKLGIIQYRSNSSNLRDGMHILECMLKLCAVEYTGWNVTHGTMYNFSAVVPNTTVLQDNNVDDMVSIIESDPAFSHNRIPNISATVTGVATAVSYRMIAGPNANITRVPVLNDEVIIVVRWVWISLPATLVCASCLFLLLIIYRTNRAENLIWKSSLTPLPIVARVLPSVKGWREAALDPVLPKGAKSGDCEPSH